MKSFVNHESYYPCEDGCSILKVTRYQTHHRGQYIIEPTVEISIYPMYPKYRGWKEQLKWIWQILTRQCVWDDQIMLDEETTKRLSATLDDLTKKVEHDKSC